MSQHVKLLTILGIVAFLSACNVSNAVQPVTPSPTAIVQMIEPTLTATATPASPNVTATLAPATSSATRAASMATSVAAPLPPGWQLVKYRGDESCTVAVPADWKVDARISSALKTDANKTNGTVSVALAGSKDWNSFKKAQLAVAVSAKVIENSATRLWFDVVGDGKDLQVGAIESTVAVVNSNGKICMSILGTDGKAASTWRELFDQIAQTVAFR